MHIDWWTLGLQTVNLLVLLWLLGRYLFRPMAAMVAQRQADADKLLDASKAAMASAEEAQKAAQAARASADAERAAAVDAAHKDGEAQRAALIEAARQEARHLQDEARAGIARMQDEADARVGRRATALAGDIAARLLEEAAARIADTVFLDGFARALADLPDTAREGIGSGQDKPVLVSARPLDGAQLAACRAAIATALGRELALDTAVDPALIAGLRFTSANVDVNASLRDDLARVLAGLEAHDG